MHPYMHFSKHLGIYICIFFQNKISYTYAFSRNEFSCIHMRFPKIIFMYLYIFSKRIFMHLCIFSKGNFMHLCIFSEWVFMHSYMHVFSNIYWKSFKVKKKIKKFSFESDWKKPLWNIGTYMKNHTKLFENFSSKKIPALLFKN